MFDRFIAFLKQIDGGSPDGRADGDDPRVAAAALMFHVVNADGVLEASELARLRELLSQTYQLTGDALDRLVEAGAEADREAIDLFAFTSVLKRHLDEAQRIDFIATLWDMVYADGVLHELEDHTMWRVADLIGVDSRERVELRRRAKAEADGRTH